MATADAQAHVTFTHSVDLRVDPVRAFEMLTRAEHLQRWFAEHVDVEPHRDGRFHFWGRHTYGVPSRDLADQRLTRFDPPHALHFEWTWEGRRGEVRLHISANNGGSTIHLSHARPGPTSACDSAEDFWIVALGNLRTYATSGKPALLPDLDGHEHDQEVALSIEIDAPVADVFAALTDPQRLNRWIAKAATVSLQPGGDYSYGWVHPDRAGQLAPCGPSRIVECIPNRLIVTDWNHEPLGPDSRVRWELTPLGDNRTRISLTHTGFSSTPEHRAHHLGWARYVLALKAFAE